MDITDTVIGFVKELSVLLIIFSAIFAYGIVRGQRALLSLTLGLYIALLISLEFPYYARTEKMLSFMSAHTIKIVFFTLFAIFGSFLFGRLLSRVIDATAIEGIGRKVILSILTTALVLAYSYHVLPITELVDPGVKIGSLFASEGSFFWWLLAPLLGIIFLF